MNIFTSLLQEDTQFRLLLNSMEEGARHYDIHGLVEESTGHFLLSLLESRDAPVFLVTANEKRAMALEEDLGPLSGDRAIYFPAEETHYFRTQSVISSTRKKRIRAMERLARGEKLIILTTLSAIKKPISPLERVKSQIFFLEAGEEADREKLLEKLIRLSYERVMTVESRGQFAVRGDILDIFPPGAEEAIRIEFFDNQIDSIRTFSIDNQRSDQKLDRVSIGPSRAFIFDSEDITDIKKGMTKDLGLLKKPKEGQNAEQAKEIFQRYLADLSENGSIKDMDLALPYVKKSKLAHLYDYLPDDGVIVYEDLRRILENEDQTVLLDQEDLTDAFSQGEILQSHLRSVQNPRVYLSEMDRLFSINLTQILKQPVFFQPDLLLEIHSLAIGSFQKHWDDFISDLKRRIREGYQLLIFAGPHPELLQGQLQESGLSTVMISYEEEGKKPLPGTIALVDRSLSRGFMYPQSRIAIYTFYEISGAREKKNKKRKKMTGSFFDYQDLEPGDYIVHEQHGIGQYQGSESMTVEGLTKDYLKISYQKSDVLYVPIEDMSLLTKYVGKEGKKPRLSSLGSGDWKKSKAKVKKAVDAIADDLIDLYAKRAKIKGHAFAPDSPWQKDFEEAFPYQETPSQLRAMEEIKKDMESDRPMDRLLCGDVGYGKTELALRAAFKAIMDGKQVAFLCPTTILTQQHYQTMVERFRSFPLRVEFLSRFKSRDQQKELIKAIHQGAVDLVVGTHRLLSQDVSFHDLGLLVIDEEQRFGVKDKEKMKRLKENVDVLTLSATPIPRTLQLSLTGIRDMSLLEEPPADRYPTTTYVLENNPLVLRDAIEREIDRNGQVFFISNRVYDIYKIQDRLQALVPRASISVAHGQMSSAQLESVMEEFVTGKTDILLSTTIVETGMDIANVNTLIVLRADRMGLSQLYQLKGRIGRSDRRSYAYFTYERDRVLNENSEKRLKAIRDFTEFGSGYKIAMRDLELRGAGNLLGTGQSGHVDAIGYELYVKLLEEAVSRAKGKAKEKKKESINVDIKVSAFIPDDYIQASSEKIRMYRKIANIENDEDYSTIIEELIDRYGDPPNSLIHLMDIMLIKTMATLVGFSQVKELEGQVELRYKEFSLFSVEELEAISKKYRGPLSFDFQKAPKFKVAAGQEKIKDVQSLLKLILKIKKSEKNGGNDE